LIRECYEEVGCEIEILWEIWKIVEYKSELNQKQISYCYYGKVISQWRPCFTQQEIEEWFEIIWLTLEETINEFKIKKTRSCIWKFILERDLMFLEEYKKIN